MLPKFLSRSLGGIRRRSVTAALVLAVTAAPVAVLAPASPAHAADGDVVIDLLLSNDFHGRINNNTVKWAWKIEDLRANTVADKHLLIGAGDMIGASEFASAILQDQPTIDVLNAIGLDASSVGNHEFDQGWNDLTNRVIDNGNNAVWDYLGANVYAKGTTDPLLPEYATFDANGVTVGVIGAVTAETATLVSPGGITNIDFGDPIDAVNRVAGELSDGNPDNGEADVIVAAFHQGASVGVGSTFDQEVAKGGEFAEMVNLDPAVNVVFNGHTHQAYAWDTPVTGGDLPTRPFLQTGSYGSNIGQVVLTYNTISDAVTGYTVANRAVPTSGVNADLIAQYPSKLTPINTTVTAALTNAAAVGNTPVGSVTAPITTAFTTGTYTGGVYTVPPAGMLPPFPGRDDRASESTLGDLVANALRDGLPADMGHADFGIVNPGGLRNELMFAGDTSSNPANTDGVVTYAEANNVLPFLNNIWLGDITGASLKKVLEQQWQRDALGNVPTRAYLALGLSDNVTVTRDLSRPEGDRITSITIDGKPVSPTKHYSVSTFSFLGTGGDNFRGFLEASWKDTGLLDRDLWISYLQGHAGLAPDFARQQVNVAGTMPAYVNAGDHVTFTASLLDLTSVGSLENTTATVWATSAEGAVNLGTVPVSGGSASVDVTVPAGFVGPGHLAVVAHPSGTLIGVGVGATTTVAPKPVSMAYGTDKDVTVTVESAGTGTPTGDVTLTADGTDVVRTYGLRIDLAAQIDLNCGVQRNQIGEPCEHGDAMSVRHRHQTHAGIAVTEVVELACPKQRTGDGYALVDFLVFVRDDARTNQVDYAVPDHAGMDPQSLVVLEHRYQGVRNRSDSNLDDRPVRNVFQRMARDGTIHIPRHCGGDLD